MPELVPDPRSQQTFRIRFDQLDAGRVTSDYPHLIPDGALYVADNVIFNRKGLVSKRPGNAFFGAAGGGLGTTGSGVLSLSGKRFYPVQAPPVLVVQSGGHLYSGNDATGAFTSFASTVSTTNKARYEQVYDPDMMVSGSLSPATVLIVVDGASVPHLWDGTHYVPVQTAAAGGSNYLPTGRTGNPITPAYVKNWKYHTVYAGEPTEPTAIYISDALRPERFNGFGLVDSAGSAYTPYFPAGRDGSLGIITGLEVVGPYLVIFYTAGIVVGYNTGTYGTYNFEFFILSTTTGCVAPASIAAMGAYVNFFGGDRFYATDANSVVPLPDMIPDIYANEPQSSYPSSMYNKSAVVGVRRGLQYLASYDGTGLGKQTMIVCFDAGAGTSEWTFGAESGGAWSRFPSGMPLSWGLECRGPGDANFPFFWGSSQGDVIAQYDTGTYDDFTQPISIEIRLKSFFLDQPINPKQVKSLYILGAFVPNYGQTASNYTDFVTPYVYTDSTESLAPTVPFAVNSGQVFYDDGTDYDNGAVYGGSSDQLITIVTKPFPQRDCIGYAVQPGLTESSKNPFNMLGMVVEATILPVAP